MSRLRAASSTIVLCALVVFAIGCRKKGAVKRSAEEQALAGFALRVVDAARAPGGLTAELVDDDLVERLRRVQLVKRATMDTMDRDKLLAALAGETGPDRRYPPAERPQKQRERATRGIQAMLGGKCSAQPWPAGLRERVAFFVGPAQAGTLPEEVQAAQREVGQKLAGAELARVTCEQGDVAFVVVKDAAGQRRLADAFPVQRATMVVNPNEPTMK